MRLATITYLAPAGTFGAPLVFASRRTFFRKLRFELRGFLAQNEKLIRARFEILNLRHRRTSSGSNRQPPGPSIADLETVVL